jgi:hypothetical protein
MEPLQRYRRRPEASVIAVQVDLELDAFTYRKWGAEQTCQRGDWLVDNAGDVYTVDGNVFARTYRRLSPGVYLKTTPVWARVAAQDGAIATKEGRSHYKAGDYLVFNNADGTDGYCMPAEKFSSLYEPDG